MATACLAQGPSLWRDYLGPTHEGCALTVKGEYSSTGFPLTLQIQTRSTATRRDNILRARSSS